MQGMWSAGLLHGLVAQSSFLTFACPSCRCRHHSAAALKQTSTRC